MSDRDGAAMLIADFLAGIPPRDIPWHVDRYGIGILAALTADGYEVVKPPTAAPREPGETGTGWDVNGSHVNVWDDLPGAVELHHHGDMMSVDEARQLAAALLAAANHAEKGLADA